MKKVLVLLMAMTMTAALVGCDGGNTDDNSSSTPKTEATTVASAEEETTVAEDTVTEMELGDSGEGEKKLSCMFFDITIPEGLLYEVYDLGFASETSGSVEVKFGKSSTIEGAIRFSTQRMQSNLEDVVDYTIELRNLDTYEEGKYEIKDDVTIGDTTYREVKISTEWDNETIYVAYYKTDAGEDAAVEIILSDDDGMTLDDPLVKELINSIVYKK